MQLTNPPISVCLPSPSRRRGLTPSVESRIRLTLNAFGYSKKCRSFKKIRILKRCYKVLIIDRVACGLPPRISRE